MSEQNQKRNETEWDGELPQWTIRHAPAPYKGNAPRMLGGVAALCGGSLATHDAARRDPEMARAGWQALLRHNERPLDPDTERDLLTAEFMRLRHAVAIAFFAREREAASLCLQIVERRLAELEGRYVPTEEPRSRIVPRPSRA